MTTPFLFFLTEAWTANVEKVFTDVLKKAYTLYQETFIIPIVDGQFEQMFDFFEELGQGSFATVYRLFTDMSASPLVYGLNLA